MKFVDYNHAYQQTLEYFNNEELPTDAFLEKYALKTNDNELLESTPTDMHYRLAKEFARIEKNKFKQPLSEEEIFGYFDHFKYIVPQGSPMYGIGNNFQTISLSNCFLCDTPEDSYGDILRVDEQMVQLCKRRGGTGVDLSKLRPIGVQTHNAAHTTTGILSWMKRYANSIGEVGQNGRRGALIELLSIHHPQILDFIQAKDKKFDKNGKPLPPEVEGANLSVKLSNEFLQAVENNTDYEQRWPVDSKNPKLSKRVNAREVWNEIIKHAHGSGEPGILMWDTVLSETPSSVYPEFKPQGTNPCCFSKKQDIYVITKQGLKEIKEITNTDLIFINETKEWVKTSGYFNQGKAKCFRVKFSNGEHFDITENHKLCKMQAKRNDTKLIYSEGELTELKNLKVDDLIAIQTNVVDDVQFSNIGTFEEGRIMGWLSGDGCLSFTNDKDAYPQMILDFWQHEHDVSEVILNDLKKMNYELHITTNKATNVKRIGSFKFVEDFINKYQFNIWKFKSETLANDFLYNASKEFLQGYISAYFTADGTVGINTESKGYNIQFASINPTRLHQIKNILTLFGIKSSISLLRKAGVNEFKNGGKYQTKDCWRITITGIDNIQKYAKYFGFLSKNKQERLNQLCDLKLKHTNKSQNYTKIVSIDEIGVEEVGCIEVDKYHKFTANGIISGNSELILSPLDSCRLLLLNLYSYVKNPFTKEASFDFELFAKHAKIAQRLMDDLVDLESEKIVKIIAKIESDPESDYIKSRELDMWKRILKYCNEGRRTGTGTTGLGDTLAALGLAYASEECFPIVENIFKTLKLSCYRMSVDMAKELGSFACYDAAKEKDSPFIQRIKQEDETLYNDMVKYGRRNIALLTISPAGTVSILTKTTSGVEPLFALTYKRRRKISNKNDKYDQIDENGNIWQVYDVYHPKILEWMRITGETDIQKSPWYGCCAQDISWVNRVKMQSIIQKNICHSISSTVNLPNTATIEDVAKVYETAWHSGCKGITVYRDGSRDGVLIAHDTTKPENITPITKTQAPKRPKELPCDIYHIKITKKLDKIRTFDYMVLVGLYNGTEPYEVFAIENGKYDKKITKGKIIRENRGTYHLIMDDGTEIKNIINDTTENEDALTRLTSTSLRHGVDIKYIVQQLSKVEGSDLFAFSKSIARALKHYIKEGVSGENCPNCGVKLIFENGCFICKSCGKSKC